MKLPADPTTPLEDEPSLPDVDRPIVVLVDASSTLERRMIEAWTERQEGREVTDLIDIRPSRRRRLGSRTDPRLHARLERGDDPWVVPVRVVWLPNERNERRTASLIDIAKLGDPRDPDPIRAHVILSRFPHRVGFVVGEGASASELLEARTASVEASTVNDFVARRAHRSLERAERQLRGNRYKVPRFLHEEILQRAGFRDGVMRLAGELGLPPELALARSRYYLREIAASHKPFVIDLFANLIYWVTSQGYGDIVYDPEQLHEIAALGEEYPIAFLPSHRSNLDRPTLQFLLWENDMPPNHTAAGINMNFFPIGPLIRNTGAFFIRRSFKDNELYKFVLRSYLDYLVENRFSLEWYLEGGRSRSGKLLPPKLGMLRWVAESVLRGKAEDLHLVPTSIAYDEIMDVGDYATEARGGDKEQESASWFVKIVMRLRSRHGNIHVRFAEPVSIRKELGAEIDSDQLDLQKLAFEVMYRISRVTPVTPTSVVSIALLAAAGETVTAPTLSDATARLSRHIAEAQLPTTEPIRLDGEARLTAILRQMATHDSVGIHEGPETRYGLDAQQAIQAAYYRNVVVHFFVPGAIAELGTLLFDPRDGVQGFWTQVDRLRDLLKFEFFFSDKATFRHEIISEMDRIDVAWRARITEDHSGFLADSDLLRAPWALLPFLEAYRIVADELVASGRTSDRKAFIERCMDRGRSAIENGGMTAAESVSKPLFSAGYDLLANRGLLEGSDERAEAFQREVGDALAAGRRVQMIARSAQRLL